VDDGMMSPSFRYHKGALRHFTHFLLVVVVVLVYGGLNMTVFDGDVFYQKTIEETLGSRPTVQLGCVVAQVSEIISNY